MFLEFKKKSGKRDSNPRPRPWQGRALPTELFPQNVSAKIVLFLGTAKKNHIFLDEKLFFLGFFPVSGLVSYSYWAAKSVVADAVSHQRLALGSFCNGACFQGIGTLALLAHDRLAYSVQLEWIVGAAVLCDTVGALSVPGHMPLKVAASDDDSVVGSQGVSLDAVVPSLCAVGSNLDVLGDVSSVVECGINVPDTKIFHADEGVASGIEQGCLNGGSWMQLGIEVKTAWEAGADQVFRITAGKDCQAEEQGHAPRPAMLHLIIYIRVFHFFVFLLLVFTFRAVPFQHSPCAQSGTRRVCPPSVPESCRCTGCRCFPRGCGECPCWA